MKNFKTLIAVVVTAAIALPLGFAAAGPMRGHPNLEAARSELEQAYNHVNAAQKANEYDMGGHAAKAKEHIEAARTEIKMAAEAANEAKH